MDSERMTGDIFVSPCLACGRCVFHRPLPGLELEELCCLADIGLCRPGAVCPQFHAVLKPRYWTDEIGNIKTALEKPQISLVLPEIMNYTSDALKTVRGEDRAPGGKFRA